MDPRPAKRLTDPDLSPGHDLGRAASARRRHDWELPMSERLARLHALCKQVTALKGSARSS